MGEIVHEAVFEGSQNGVRSYAVTMSSGTATLQKLAGNNPDTDTWVDVTDGTHSVNAEATMHCPYGIKFRFRLTGDAAGWISA